MLLIVRDCERGQGRHCYWVRRQKWRTEFFKRIEPSYYLNPVYLLGQFPIWPKMWLKIVFVKFWKRGWLE